MIILGVLCALSIICLAIESHLNRVEVAKIRAEFAEERQILLNRIQDPNFKPPSKIELTPAQKREYLERVRVQKEEADQMGLVGQIID